jgi:hypothetical protein
MAESVTAPRLLDLDTLISRPTVRIDGVDYELLSPNEVSVLDYRRLTRPGVRMVEIENLADPTPDEKAEYERILDTQCRQILLAPDEVHARLRSAERDRILATFLRLRERWMRQVTQTGATPAAATPDAEPTTGAN